MGIRDVLKASKYTSMGQLAPVAKPGNLYVKVAGETSDANASRLESIRRQLYQNILREVDIARFDPVRDLDAFRAAAQSVIDRTLSEQALPLSREEKDELSHEVVEEAIGMGPLGPLMADPAVSDILVNGHKQVYIERFGKLEATNVRFENEAHLMRLIERIVARVGRHVDQSTPLVDARLPDGSRINAIIPPLALSGPTLSIRRFGHGRLSADDLVKFGTVPSLARQLLEGLVRTRTNIMVSGGTGTGKTTLLNVLSSFISPTERIVTIEDAAELQLQQEHVVRLESRPPNIEGQGAVTIHDLVVNALRMRPDRIVVGEVRSKEALDMLQAMTTGHEGSMTTIHANSAREAFKRLETMVLMAGIDLPSRAIRDLMAAAIHVVIQVSRLQDGTRKLDRLSEVVGLEGDNILLQDIVVYEPQEYRENRVVGRHVATGVRPHFLTRLEKHGMSFPATVFQKGNVL